MAIETTRSCELVPFRVVDADGKATELTYSAPRPARDHDERAVLDRLPWFDSGLVVRGGAIIHRMGLGSWQRGREVIWSKALTALGVPIYLTIHGRGIGEPGAGLHCATLELVRDQP